MSKNFTINIDANALNDIKAANLNLCIAKMVNSEYTVVWASILSADVEQSNSFSFNDEYEAFSLAAPLPAVYAAIAPGVGTAVRTGQTVDFSGTTSTGVTGNMSSNQPITVRNTAAIGGAPPNDSHFGLMATLTSPLIAPAAVTAIHLSPFATPPTTSTAFNPTNRIKVWFQRDWLANTFIPTAAGKGISIDLTKKDDASVLFNNTNTWLLLNTDSLAICAKDCEDALHLMTHTEAEYLILFTHGVCASQRMQFFRVFNTAFAGTGRKVVSVRCESPCSFRVKMQFPAFVASSQFFWDNVINDINQALRTVLNTRTANLLSPLETWQIITVNICERTERLHEDVSVHFEDCTTSAVCGADLTNTANCATRTV